MNLSIVKQIIEETDMIFISFHAIHWDTFGCFWYVRFKALNDLNVNYL